MHTNIIYFIFVNFNNHAITYNCVKSINQITNNGFEIKILVIDNSSDLSDYNSLKLKIGKINNVHLFRSDENLGYFGGLNVGISKIDHSKMPIVVIGNNDLVFPMNFIDTIEKKLNLLKIYPVISPNIITLDGNHQNPHVINKISKFRELVYDIYFTSFFLAKTIKIIAQVTKSFTDRQDEKQHETAQCIYQGYGACYILGPLFFKHFDLLWAPTFLMGEEFFLSKQLESKNFKIYYEPSIVVKHQLHSSTNNIPSKKIWGIARESHKEYRKYIKIWK